MFSSLKEKKKSVCITDSDKKYGKETVGEVFLSVLLEGDNIIIQDDWSSVHLGWIIQNPDGTFWLDSLSQSEEDTRNWWSNKERALKYEALGFKVVRVKICKDGYEIK